MFFLGGMPTLCYKKNCTIFHKVVQQNWKKNTDFDIHILNLRNYYFKNTKNKYVNLQ